MQKHFTSNNILAMEKQKRARFVNSIVRFISVSLVVTVDNHWKTNLAIFSYSIHLGANPA